MYSLIIIDDETELLDGLSNFFPWEKLGFSVEAAFEDGMSALSYLKTHEPDAILTDIHLPFMSGLELIEKITQLKKDKSPIFCIMSAYSEFEYAKKAITLNVIEYLVKPASFTDISKTFEKIRKKLDEQHLRNTNTTIYNHPIIDKAIKIMETEIATASLQSIADNLELHASYLSRLFKEVTGSNFLDYLIKLKMELAAKMLKSEHSYTNQDVADALGYQDKQNFCRIFKKYYGVSPQMYISEKGGQKP